MKTELSFEIVLFSRISASLLPYPNYSNNFINANILTKIHCSEIYQKVRLEVIGHATDESTIDMSYYTEVLILPLHWNVIQIDKPIISALNPGTNHFLWRQRED